MASTIFQKYLQNGATDPVNVDFQVSLASLDFLNATSNIFHCKTGSSTFCNRLDANVRKPCISRLKTCLTQLWLKCSIC